MRPTGSTYSRFSPHATAFRGKRFAGLPLLFGALAFAGLPLRLRPVLLELIQTLDFQHEKLDKSRGCLVDLGPVFTHILVYALALTEASLIPCTC
jgi:hypothetical protein